jgi:hypothetical protein
METITPILVGALCVILGSLIKILLDWEEIRPGAPMDRRGRALFRQMYLAPDLVVLAIGLLISSKGLQCLLAAKNVISPLGERLPFWFSLFMYAYLCSLLASVVLWLIAGENKYIPIEPKHRTIIGIDGRPRTEVVDSPSLLKGLLRKEGFLTLISGNLISLACISSYAVFVVKAF